MIGLDQEVINVLNNQNGPIPVRFLWGPHDGHQVMIQGLTPVIRFNDEPYMVYKIQGIELLYTWVLDDSPVQPIDTADPMMVDSSGQQDTN